MKSAGARFPFLPDCRAVAVYREPGGGTRVRAFAPVVLYFGSDESHPNEQWLMDAVDVETGELQTFALSGFVAPAADHGEVKSP